MKIREKILNGIELTSEEIQQFWWEDFNREGMYRLHTEYLESAKDYIIKDARSEKCFKIHLPTDIYRNLTFPSQIAVEVEPREKTIIEYVPIEKGE